MEAILFETSVRQHPAIDDGDTMANSAQVKAMLGGVSDMFIHRHSRDPDPTRRFPQPDAIIANRRYWFRGTIRTWIRAQGGRTRTTLERIDT